MQLDAPNSRPAKPIQVISSLFKGYFLAIILTAFIALIVRLYLVEAFRVPTNFMAPTLLSGDYIFAHKMFKTIRRGDVVIFSFPNDPRKDFIKRVIGVAGDSVEIRNGLLFVNGEQVSKPGEIRNESEAMGGTVQEFSETIGRHHYTSYSTPLSSPEVQKMIEVKVPQNELFVLGDNRLRGQDSRVWGFLNSELVKAKAVFIWLSIENGSGSSEVRWKRILKKVD